MLAEQSTKMSLVVTLVVSGRKNGALFSAITRLTYMLRKRGSQTHLLSFFDL